MRRALLLAALAAACAGESAPTGPAAAHSLQITFADTVMLIGNQGLAVAALRDAQGAQVPGSVTWTSSDTTTVRVSASGVLTGMELGSAWIVGRHDTLADSVAVRAAAPGLALGDMDLRILGPGATRARWGAFGEFRDLLVADTGELSALGGSALGGDSTMTLFLPARLASGRVTLVKHDFAARPGSAASAYVRLHGPAAGDVTLLGGLAGGTLDVVMDEPPAGLVPGEARGTLAFRAVRYVPGPGGQPVETADTARVFIEFRAHWYHYLRPFVQLTLTGGPAPGGAKFSTARVDDDGRGGISVSWDSDLDLLPQAARFEIQQEVRLASPRTGAFPVAALAPPAFNDPVQWPAVYSALFYRDDPRIALSTGGTLTVTKYVAPTDELYGEIHGTLSAPLALWSAPGTVSADTALASVTFAVQLYPLGGIPAVRSYR